MDPAAPGLDFIWTANLTKLAYMVLAFAIIAATAALFERVLGLNPEQDIDAIQKAAKDGNALPLAVLYLGCFMVLAVVVNSVLS